MGDRTFSAEDVLRIYELYLDEREMETVENFFMVEEGETIDLSFVVNLLEILENLLSILGRTSIAALAATFAPFVLAALNEALRGLRDTNQILGRIVEQGGVDA